MAARPLVLYGGIAVAVVSVGHQVVSAVETHNFAVGHDFSSRAVDHALTKGAANMIVEYIDLLAGLALAAGMIAVMIGASASGCCRAGWASSGSSPGSIFLPIGGAELQVVPAFWMVMMGILLIGRWPSGEPPAWAAGEARPWPSAAAARRARGWASRQPPARPPQRRPSPRAALRRLPRSAAKGRGGRP